MNDEMIRKNSHNEGTVVLPEELIQRLKAHAGEAWPEECCGLLFGSITYAGIIVITEGVRIENHDSRKQNHYGIDPLELLEFEKEQKERGNEILGSYHSHPDLPAIPSEEDLREMIPEMLYLILSVSKENTGRIRAWRKDQSSKQVRELRIFKS